MKKQIILGMVAALVLMWGAANEAFAFGSYGSSLNSACTPATPYSGDCLLCHTSGDYAATTPAKDAFLAGGTTLSNYFCPAGPTCTDSDGDGYAIQGGSCGPVDCNDGDAAVNPGAAEVCTDGRDNDCDGLIDTADPNAVGCPVACTDSDRDSFSPDGGTCGPLDCNDQNPAINPAVSDIPNNGVDEDCNGSDSVDGSIVDNDGDGFSLANGDCDDTNAAINPDALENCLDRLDNNCNGLIDSQDPDASNCPTACIDADGDTYAMNGATCGQVDCDDTDVTVNPGASELCGDTTDNDCDGQINEGCEAGCLDADGDGFIAASCGGSDCDDSNPAVNPGEAERCGDGIDANCNGNSDEECQNCPDGSILIIKEMSYNHGDRKLELQGRANYRTTITVTDGATGAILASGIKVKEGQWHTKLRNLPRSIEWIRVITTEGCFVDRFLPGESHDTEGSGHAPHPRKQGGHAD